MGLFGKKKKAAAQDTRPDMPQALFAHLQRDCIKVYGTQYNQDAVNMLVGDTATVAILKDKDAQWDSYPVVNAATGARLGAVYDEQLAKSGLKNGYTAIAEIHRPIYYGQGITELYLPFMQEAIEHRDKMAALKLWSNLEASKLEVTIAGEEYVTENAEILTRNVDGKKPVFVVMGDGMKLFEVNSRMKMYKELEERAQYKPRKLIVNKSNGTTGLYYRVGFYY